MDAPKKLTAEEKRLEESRERKSHWKRWGPYVSERAWGTVREDYSTTGTAWEFLPHDHARSKAYRWNEDGIAGVCDRHQHICWALALWNEKDRILKERIFGLTGNEGNHGEDVKEYYFYLDSTPTHSYMKYLYKYPHAAFPYLQLREENARRGKHDSEFELMDTGVFDEDRYFDVVVEYAKASPEDLLIRIGATNRGPTPARLHLLPTIWFRNTWSWSKEPVKPRLAKGPNGLQGTVINIDHPKYGRRYLYIENKPSVLFTENETNSRRLYGSSGPLFCKDGINDFVVNGRIDAVKKAAEGTKAAPHYRFTVAPGETVTVKQRLTDQEWPAGKDPLNGEFDRVFMTRKLEANEYYERVIPSDLADDAKNVMRQSIAGLLWSKQFYHYVQREWLDGDPAGPPPPAERKNGCNRGWNHLYNADVISMPDEWEYPWYAAWDLAFHCVPLALVDAEFAKEQLVLLTRVVVHASQWPVAGLRVGVGLPKPAGACVGSVARVQDRQEATGSR